MVVKIPQVAKEKLIQWLQEYELEKGVDYKLRSNATHCKLVWIETIKSSQEQAQVETVFPDFCLRTLDEMLNPLAHQVKELSKELAEACEKANTNQAQLDFLENTYNELSNDLSIMVSKNAQLTQENTELKEKTAYEEHFNALYEGISNVISNWSGQKFKKLDQILRHFKREQSKAA